MGRYVRDRNIKHRWFVINTRVINKKELSYKDVVGLFEDINYKCGDQYELAVTPYVIDIQFNVYAMYLHDAISSVCTDLDDVDLIDSLHDIEVGE